MITFFDYRSSSSESDSSTDEVDNKARLMRRGYMVQQVKRQLERISEEWAKHCMDADNVNFRALDHGIKLLRGAVSDMQSNAERMARKRVSPHNLTPEQSWRIENMSLYQLKDLPSAVARGSGSGLGGGASSSGGDACICSGLGGLRRGKGRGVTSMSANFSQPHRSSPCYGKSGWKR